MTKLRLKSRKLRKGGNGNSSSSYQVSLKNLLILLDKYQSYLWDMKYGHWKIKYGEYGEDATIENIQDKLNDIKNRIISIFRNNSFDLLTLSEDQTYSLLYAVLRTDEEIVEAYANAYANLETKEKMPIEIIDYIILEFENELNNNVEFDDEELYDYYENALIYLNIIDKIIKQERPLRMKQKVGDTAMTISSIQPMETNKRYFLPPNVKKAIAEFIHNPRYYKLFSSKPTLYSRVISNSIENIKKMPSRKKNPPDNSSSNATIGGRKTRRKRKKNYEKKTE
jgi:hypothetical protein